jgi:hypothetical protein
MRNALKECQSTAHFSPRNERLEQFAQMLVLVSFFQLPQTALPITDETPRLVFRVLWDMPCTKPIENIFTSCLFC